jgi:hypothetical protein
MVLEEEPVRFEFGIALAALILPAREIHPGLRIKRRGKRGNLSNSPIRFRVH